RLHRVETGEHGVVGTREVVGREERGAVRLGGGAGARGEHVVPLVGAEPLEAHGQAGRLPGGEQVGAAGGGDGRGGLGVLAALAGVEAQADDQVAVHRGEGHAAFLVHALAAGRVLVAAAVHQRDGVVQHVVGAVQVHAPVSRVGEAAAVGQGRLHE